jgi:glycosyltransferase involved in cell wall biosynthesis
MRILYHHRTRGKNVEGIHIREIVNSLKELGHEVHVLSPPGSDPMTPTDNEQHKVTKIWDWVSKHFPQIGFEILELCYNFIGYFRLKKTIKEYKINAIYERYAFFTWAGAYIAKKKNIPIILEVNEISGIERVRGQVLVRFAKMIEKRIFKTVNAIVVVSDFLKNQISDKMGINADKIYVMPNAFNPKKFNPDIDGSNTKSELRLENKIVIGFVGSFVNWSNLDSLIQVFGEISRKKQDAHLMLVGDGPMRDILEKMVNDEDIKDKVTFTGSVSHADVSKYIANMDICLIPQSNEYRSPVKLFEYMAMAKPVIAPRLEPIEKIVTHEKNGILFNQSDDNSLKNAIIYLMENDEKRQRIASLAYETVMNNYTWQKNAEKILGIYSMIIFKNNR